MMMFDGNGLLTVVDGMIACGMDHDALFQDETQAQRLATDIFGNQFSACLDVTFKELDEHFKTYTDLTPPRDASRSARESEKTSKHLCSGHVTSCVSDVILP